MTPQYLDDTIPDATGHRLTKTMDEGSEARPTKGYSSKTNNYGRILTLLAVAIYTGFRIWQTHLITSNNIADATGPRLTKIMDEGSGARPTKGYWGKPNNYIRILTLLAIAIYTGFQIWQTHLISSNNVVSQRAFISIRPIAGYISLDQSEHPAAANFLVDFVNNGNTGTRDLHALYKCASSVEDLQEPWPLLHQGPQLTANTRFLVGPHSSEGGGCGFTFDDIQQMIGDTCLDICLWIPPIVTGLTRASSTEPKWLSD